MSIGRGWYPETPKTEYELLVEQLLSEKLKEVFTRTSLNHEKCHENQSSEKVNQKVK